MLPSAQKYLSKGGLAPDAAGYVTVGCFMGGIIGIQLFSRLLHHYIPSQVVDCDHSHDDDPNDAHDHAENTHSHDHAQKPNGSAAEITPLLPQPEADLAPRRSRSAAVETFHRPNATNIDVLPTRRPTMQTRFTTRVSTFVSGAKASCDEGGPCYGYSDPCGHQCLKVMSRTPTRAFGRFSSIGPPRQPSLLRTATTPHAQPKLGRPTTFDEESADLSPGPALQGRPLVPPSGVSANTVFRGREGHRIRGSSLLRTEQSIDDHANGHKLDEPDSSDAGSVEDPSHHHHVPENAFLAIGLQTSIAIALHKLPEGFITYATNHANPKLGFTVFMALFIHNITEGFAMALPLYLAINSRWKAMFWSSLLGGVSQPLGAGVAALWFKIAGGGDSAPGDTVYGCMFGITAGIMASVALQLFSESLSLTHNRNLCTAYAFLGMGILGFSFALTA